MFDTGLASVNAAALAKTVVAGAAAGAIGAKLGLDMVDTEIDGVLDILNKELKEIEGNNVDFAVAARIEPKSFGQGSEAVNLGEDHAKAHAVVVETLTSLISDLEIFSAAVRDARVLVNETDEDAKVRLTAVLNRAETLDLGHYAYSQAQDNHRGDPPLEDQAPDSTESGDA